LEELRHNANRVSPQEHLLQVEPTNVPYHILEALSSQVINLTVVHLANPMRKLFLLPAAATGGDGWG